MPDRVHPDVTEFNERLHTVTETCDTLRIKPTKCWQLIKAGSLEAVRLGRRSTRVKGSSIDRLIRNGYEESHARLLVEELYGLPLEEIY